MRPMSVLAADDNPKNTTVTEVSKGDTMNENNGTITTNYGTVTTNNGTIQTNNGHIEKNYGTVTTNANTIVANYGIATNNGAGTVLGNCADGSVTGGTIMIIEGGTATDCSINSMVGGTATDCIIMMEMKDGTAKECSISAKIEFNVDGSIKEISGGMLGGEATKATIVYMQGGTATECEITYEMKNGTAIDSTIKKMTGGTARGANTKIIEYAGGNIENTISPDNIENYASGYGKDDIKWVDPLPTGGGSTPSGGAAVSTPEPVIPESPYRVFLLDTIPQVKNAAQGATVELKMDGWNTLPLWFMKEIAARRDLTIHMTYRYEGLKYDVTFSAGMVINCQDDEGKEIDYFGPLKLADMAVRAKASCVVTK